jgi:hypothetical protein
MHIPHGRWHSNFVWPSGSDCRTQPTVISNPLNEFLFLCFTPAQRLDFSRTAHFQWCLSPTCSPADAAYRPRDPEPARLHYLPASLASPGFPASTPSCWATSLQCQILLLLSRHPAFHGCSQSLHIILPNEPATCGTWIRLVVSRWTILFPTFHLLPIPAPALLALAVAPTHCTPSIHFYCRPGHPEPTQVSQTLYRISRARHLLIAAACHHRGTLPLHRRACILLSPAPHFAPPPFTCLPFRNRSRRPASRHIFSSLTILSTPHPSKNAVLPHSFSKSDFSTSQFPLALTL